MTINYNKITLEPKGWVDLLQNTQPKSGKHEYICLSGDSLIRGDQKKLKVSDIVAFSKVQFGKLKANDKEFIEFGPKIVDLTEKVIKAKEDKIPDYTKVQKEHPVLFMLAVAVFCFVSIPAYFWFKSRRQEIDKLRESVAQMRSELKPKVEEKKDSQSSTTPVVSTQAQQKQESLHDDQSDGASVGDQVEEEQESQHDDQSDGASIGDQVEEEQESQHSSTASVVSTQAQQKQESLHDDQSDGASVGDQEEEEQESLHGDQSSTAPVVQTLEKEKQESLHKDQSVHGNPLPAGLEHDDSDDEVSSDGSSKESIPDDGVETKAKELLQRNKGTATKAYLIEQGLRSSDGHIDLNQISHQFQAATGEESLFQLLCKSLTWEEYNSIIQSNLSRTLKTQISSGVLSFHFAVSFLHIQAKNYIEKVVQEDRVNYVKIKQNGQLTFENWDPVKGSKGKPVMPKDISVPSEDVMPKKNYKATKEQIERDIKWRGDNVTLSYHKSGKLINASAKELLNRHGTVEALGKEILGDGNLDRFVHILKTKPEEVDEREYIVAHLLFLSSQNSFNQLGIIATMNGFTPTYSNDPKTTHSEFLVDFEAVKVGLAQTASGVGISSGNRPPKVSKASFMVKIVFDGTKEKCNAPATTIHVFDRGAIEFEQFRKGLSPKL